MKISKGNRVEVFSDEDGFLGSYFEAEVVAKVAGEDRFKVEYIHLLSESDEKKRLTEVVEGFRVRPVPPEIRVSWFDVLDKVDVYDGDGWWTGRVTGRQGCNYGVYFESTGDEIVYHGSKIRVHQEFENGQWIPSQTKGCTMN